MTLDFGALRSAFIDAAVTAVNAVAGDTAEIARDKAPVRKIFSGGRQSVRFKTAEEINADRGLRARLGLGPEIEASAANRAALGRKFKNPGTGKVETLTEKSFATTVERPGRTHTVHRDRRGEHTDTTHVDRPRLTRNRANLGSREGFRERTLGESGHLLNRNYEAALTARGRYELKTERAASRALGPIAADINARTGAVERIHYGPHGPERLGGALRESIHVEQATADQFPVIKASVVAGGKDAPYAKYQELGTRHNPAHPFLRPALAVAKDKLPGALKRAIARIVGGSRR